MESNQGHVRRHFYCVPAVNGVEWSGGEPESYAIIENHGASCFITAGLEVLGENGRVLPKHEVLRIFKDEADVRFTNPDWDSLLNAI